MKYSHRDELQAEHVFVFGVGGRTGTTALQHWLNNTGEIRCVGEFPDDQFSSWVDLVASIANMVATHDRTSPTWAPTSSLRGIIEVIAPHSRTGRGGCKQVTIRDVKALQLLRHVFPNSTNVYLFREPVDHWRSYSRFRVHMQSSSVSRFCYDYARLVGVYSQVPGIWVEFDSMRDRASELFERLCLPLPASKVMDKYVHPTTRRMAKTHVDLDFVRQHAMWAYDHARRFACLS